MGRDKAQEAGFNPLAWMFTFSDLVTLLLTFFVMLLSMKAPEVTKLQAMFGVFADGGSASMNLADRGAVADMKIMMDSLRQPSSGDFASLDQELAEALNLPASTQAKLGGLIQPGVTLSQDKRGSVITLSNDILYPPGRSELSPQAKVILAQVAQVLRHGEIPVSIEGYTDDLSPGGASPASDNWGLSLARATAVLNYLTKVEKIYPGRFRLGALGYTRPLAPNDSPAHRAMNRRTEIVLLADK